MAKVLVIGSGGREHALVWKLRQSKDVEAVYCAPGNAGTALEGINVPIKESDFRAPADFFRSIAGFVRKEDIYLTVVGPEDPLVNGIVNHFYENNLVQEGHFIFGPHKEAAELEGSKASAKEFMERHKIPTAEFKIFEDYDKAYAYIKNHGDPVVIKASGLAAGKGSFVCLSLDDAVEALDRIMNKKEFGEAGKKIVVEDFMDGEEASILTLTDGKTILPLISSQDHKRIYDGDAGPNTGGMGAYAPAPIVTEEVMKKVHDKILAPTIKGMAKEGSPFIGCLYAGLMIKNNEPKVVEFNIRFGDPEAQPVLSLLENDLYVLLDACIKGKLHEHEIKNKEGAACCVVMASGGYPGKYEKGKPIIGLGFMACKAPNVYAFHAGTMLDKNNITVTNGGRVLGITGIGNNIEEAVDFAYNGVKWIHWENEYHRKDIGAKALKR